MGAALTQVGGCACIEEFTGKGGGSAAGFSEAEIADAVRQALEEGVRYAIQLASQVEER